MDDNVGNKLALTFEDTGEQALKNIEFPVRIFNVFIGAAVAAPAVGDTPVAATPALAIDGTPSIAVLPFNNMSNDPDQEYFSDGISEDIITDLSKISGLFVIGRNTSFTYKGKSVQLQQVAKELGVRYILEGSVRKAGQRVRITGQLIDGMTGGHIWADRFDRDLTDIFAIQDEITQTIVEQLKIRLLPEEKAAIEALPTVSVEACNFYLRGRQLFYTATKSSLSLARQMFTRAIELDSAYALAYAGIAQSASALNMWYGLAIPIDENLAMIDKALELSPNLADAYAARGAVLANANRRPEAAASFEHALALDPDNHEANAVYGRFCMTDENYARAVTCLSRALETRHDDFSSPIFLHTGLRQLGRFEDASRYAELAIKRAEDALQLHPEVSLPAQLGAGLLAEIGDNVRAKAWLERSLAIDRFDNKALYNGACTYALLGDVDRAVEILEAVLPLLGPEVKGYFLIDPDLAAIRSHPRHPILAALAAV